MKYVLFFLLCVTNIIIPNLVNAQPSSFIPHGEWGSDYYDSTAKLDGNYYVHTSNKIDVINPNLSGQNSLIASFIPKELSSSWIRSIDVFENHLVVVSPSTLFIYEVKNVSELTLKYSVDASFLPSTVVTDKLYVVAKTEIFVIEFVDGVFKIFDVIDIVKDFSGSISTVYLNVIDDHIVLLALTFDRKGVFSFLVELYQEGSHEFVKRYLNPFDEDLFISAAIAIDRKRIVISDSGKLKTLNLENNVVELENNFQTVKKGSTSHLAFYNNIVWANTNDSLISYNIDDANNVSVYSEIDFIRSPNESIYIGLSDMEWHDNTLSVISSRYGVSEVQLTDDKHFEQVKYLFNHTGEKGHGVIDGSYYYVTNLKNATVNKLAIGKNKKVSLESSQELNQRARDINRVNDNYLFNDNHGVSLKSTGSDNQFNDLSNSTYGVNDITANEEYVFGTGYVNSKESLLRFKIGSEFDLYESPEIIEYPEEASNYCPEKSIIYKELLLVEDRCLSGQLHLFENIFSDNLSWSKLVKPTEDMFYVKTVVVGDYLYFIDKNKIRIAQISESLEVEILAEKMTETQDRPMSTLLVENLLFISLDSQVFVYNVEEPLNPILVDQFNALYANHVEMAYGDGMLARTAAYAGVIEFFQLNQAPEFPSSILTINEDTQLMLTDYISDPESETYSLSVISESINGVFSGEGNVIYTPNQDFNGEDTFTVKVEDVHGNFIEKEITVTILPIDDAPVAESLNISVSHNGSDSGALMTNDVDGDALTYSLVSDASNGTLSLSTSGEYSYAANTGYSGADSFTYEMNDGTSAAQGIITLSVQAPKEESGGGSFGGLLLFTLMYLSVARIKREYPY